MNISLVLVLLLLEKIKYDQTYASSLFPHITSATHGSPRSKTFIDNIFSTDTIEEVISGNIFTSISDHLAQFLLFPLSQTKHDKKNEIYKHTFKHFKADNFLMLFKILTGIKH